MSEHFTKQAICDMAGIRHEYLNRIIDRYPDFPICYISKKSQVIPKFRFFPWYDKHKDDSMIKDKFDHDSIAVIRAGYRPGKELQPIIKDYYRAQMLKEKTKVNFNEYQELARRTQNPHLSFPERRMHALHGIAAEAGEIHGIYQKTYQGHTLDVDKIVDEMGDLMWFLAELADVLRVSLDDVAHRNVAKLKRRYPDGFSEHRSVNREENE